jgi:hypothetical protein
VTLPAGSGFELGIAAADLPDLSVEPGRVDGDSGGFPLRALEIGRGGERSALACGAAAGRLLWRRLVPAVRTSDCAAGRLTLAGLRLDQGAAASLDGSGFTVRNGRANLWRGFGEFRQNDVVRTALGFLLAGLVGWAFVRLRGGRAAR